MLHFIHHYQTLDPRLFHHQSPSPLDCPQLAHLNHALIQSLGLDALTDDAWQQIISGNLTALNQHSNNQIQPLAMAYAGHQFGHWAGRLGDGRGLLIAELSDGDNHAELHLKGAGRTPYSRHGDGRAMIASTVREYLCGHALNRLGVASSDALGFVVSQTPIQRYSIERAAMLLRVSDCHLRLGHIEYVALYMPDYFATFIDKIILHYYPQFHHKFNQKSTDIPAFIQAICTNTATMIANWQLVGFSHGVMNTDNLNLTGTTLDFGPFGFMEKFNPKWQNNHSDSTGRYCYENQPSIGHWNLATALQHFHQLSITQSQLMSALDAYEQTLNNTYERSLIAKLGFQQQKPTQTQLHLAYQFLSLIETLQADYTNSFRMLIALFEQPNAHNAHEHRLLAEFCACLGEHTAAWQHWRETYLQHMHTEQEIQAVIATLKANNPIYVLRNAMAQKAIDSALEDDFGEVARLFELLSNPYVWHSCTTPEDTHSASMDEQIAVSCMS